MNVGVLLSDSSIASERKCVMKIVDILGKSPDVANEISIPKGAALKGKNLRPLGGFFFFKRSPFLNSNPIDKNICSFQKSVICVRNLFRVLATSLSGAILRMLEFTE